MDHASYYLPNVEPLCQGDVFDRVPLAYVLEAPRSLTQATVAGGREGFALGDLLSEGPPRRGGPPVVPACCDYARAVMLTYDCEIDKPSAKVLTLTLVRPLDPSTPEAGKALIREGRKLAYFYLPAGSGMVEAYVDFRRVGAIGVELLRASPRVGRLAQDPRKAMLFQFFQYLTRINLHRGTLPPPGAEEA